MYFIRENENDKKAPLHFKPQDGVETIQFLFRLFDENKPSNNIVFNYYNFPNIPQKNEEIKMIPTNIDNLNCFNETEKSKIKELNSDIKKLKNYIYIELNCIIQLYNTNERKWMIILDNNNEKQNLQLKKFIFWGYNGLLKINREGQGIIKHKFIYRNVKQDIISIHDDIPLTTTNDIVMWPKSLDSFKNESKIIKDLNKII